MIEFKEVEKRYPNGFEALKHINLTIDQGEFVAIIGLSGAGKSTLIRTINRNARHYPGPTDGGRHRCDDPAWKKLAEISSPYRHDFPVLQPDYPHTVIKNVLTAFVP